MLEAVFCKQSERWLRDVTMRSFLSGPCQDVKSKKSYCVIESVENLCG
jgi:hypothetical protein